MPRRESLAQLHVVRTSMRAAGRFTNLPSASSGYRARLGAKAVRRHRARADIVDAMRHEDIWDHEAARQYDTPGTGMFAPEVLGPTLDRLAGLAGDGRALEFAVGTGRVAVPLAQRGVPVTGIELSRPMIEQLRTKAGEAAIPVIAGDMATARVPGRYTLVYLVYNAISALLTQGEQVACFRNAARHLVPGGRVVIELWVPELRKLPLGQQATVWRRGTPTGPGPSSPPSPGPGGVLVPRLCSRRARPLYYPDQCANPLTTNDEAAGQRDESCRSP